MLTNELRKLTNELRKLELILTISAQLQAVNAQDGIVQQNLLWFDISQCFYGVKAGIFRQSHRDRLQRISKGSHGILLDGGDLKGNTNMNETIYLDFNCFNWSW